MLHNFLQDEEDEWRRGRFAANAGDDSDFEDPLLHENDGNDIAEGGDDAPAAPAAAGENIVDPALGENLERAQANARRAAIAAALWVDL